MSDTGDNLLYNEVSRPNPYLFRIERMVYLFVPRFLSVWFDAAVLFLALRVFSHRFLHDKPLQHSGKPIGSRIAHETE